MRSSSSTAICVPWVRVNEHRGALYRRGGSAGTSTRALLTAPGTSVGARPLLVPTGLFLLGLGRCRLGRCRPAGGGLDRRQLGFRGSAGAGGRGFLPALSRLRGSVALGLSHVASVGAGARPGMSATRSRAGAPPSRHHPRADEFSRRAEAGGGVARNRRDALERRRSCCAGQLGQALENVRRPGTPGFKVHRIPSPPG